MALRALGIETFGDATEEERQALLDHTLDKLLLVGPAVVGKVASKPVEAGMKALTRGARSSAHTLEALGIPQPARGAVADVATEIGLRAAAGATGAALMDAAPEGPYGDLTDWQERGIGGLFGAMGAQVTGMSDWLLRRHPELRQWATSAAKGRLGAAIGAVIGLGLLAAKEQGLGALFGEEPDPEPRSSRSAVRPSDPNAIPQPQWGRRPPSQSGGPGVPVPQPGARVPR